MGKINISKVLNRATVMTALETSAYKRNGVYSFGLVRVYIYIYKVTERLRWSRGSVLAFSTQVRVFKLSRNRRIFRTKKSSERLPSEGK